MAVRNDANQDSPVARIQSAGFMPIVVFGILSIAFGIILAMLLPAFNILPPQASEEARRTDALFTILLVIGGVVFFLVQGLIYYAAIAFRAKANDVTDGPNIHGNTTLEIVWTVIPSIIVIVLAILSFITWRDNTALPENPNVFNGESIDINAYGQRYAWSFEYLTNEEDVNGEQIVLNSNELHVYAGQGVYLEMETRDVIHSFWVPAMRVKQDLLPGRITSVVFRPIDPVDDGWEFVNTFTPVTIYNDPDENSDVVYSIESQVQSEGDQEDAVQLELFDQEAESLGEWVEVITPDGELGFIRGEDVTGRYNRYRLICTELCGGGHGAMFSWVRLHESEEAMLDAWYTPQVDARRVPSENPLELGEQVLDSGAYPCANCHVLDALGWNGNLGPSLNGIGSRAASRAQAAGLENGADYLAQAIRRPNEYLVSGYAANIMPYFGNTADAPDGAGSFQSMPQDELNGIVAYLCAQTDSGDPMESTCGIDWEIDNGELLDVQETADDLTVITDDYQE